MSVEDFLDLVDVLKKGGFYLFTYQMAEKQINLLNSGRVA